MNKRILKDGLLWGFVLWLVGYILGIILFVVVPHNLIGWVIMPFGILMTLGVLFKKVRSPSFQHYVIVGFIWTAIAIVCDYFLLVKVFKPSDGYYKLDVYLYYFLTLALPLLVGWKKISKTKLLVSL